MGGLSKQASLDGHLLFFYIGFTFFTWKHYHIWIPDSQGLYLFSTLLTRLVFFSHTIEVGNLFSYIFVFNIFPMLAENTTAPWYLNDDVCIFFLYPYLEFHPRIQLYFDTWLRWFISFSYTIYRPWKQVKRLDWSLIIVFQLFPQKSTVCFVTWSPKFASLYLQMTGSMWTFISYICH